MYTWICQPIHIYTYALNMICVHIDIKRENKIKYMIYSEDVELFKEPEKFQRQKLKLKNICSVDQWQIFIISRCDQHLSQQMLISLMTPQEQWWFCEYTYTISYILQCINMICFRQDMFTGNYYIRLTLCINTLWPDNFCQYMNMYTMTILMVGN